MTEFVIIILALFCVALIWAYNPDYKRNPKEFWRTLIGMPIGLFLGGIGFTKLDERIKNWALKKKQKTNTEK